MPAYSQMIICCHIYFSLPFFLLLIETTFFTVGAPEGLEQNKAKPANISLSIIN